MNAIPKNDPTLRDDPNVKIPPAVKAAAERANQMHEMYRDKTEGEVTPEGNKDDTPAGGDQKVTPQGNSDDGTNPDTKTDAKAEPKAGDTPDTNPDAKLGETPSKEAAADPNDQSWEHKYKTTDGRFKKLQEEHRKLQNDMVNLRGVVAAMQAAPAKVEPDTNTPPAPDLSPENLLTPEEMSDYGEDFLNVVGKRARQELAQVTASHKKEIDDLKRQLASVGQFVQQDTHAKMLGSLDAQLPNWRELNTEPKFLDWLSLSDPYSGANRHDMLKAAYAQGDASRVANFFKGFLAEEAAVAPAGQTPEPQGQTVPKVPLKDLAAPGRAKTAATNPAPAEKPIISRAQVAEFYADVASGKYRGRDEEKNKAEAMIFAAQADGRIR